MPDYRIEGLTAIDSQVNVENNENAYDFPYVGVKLVHRATGQFDYADLYIVNSDGGQRVGSHREVITPEDQVKAVGDLNAAIGLLTQARDSIQGATFSPVDDGNSK